MHAPITEFCPLHQIVLLPSVGDFLLTPISKAYPAHHLRCPAREWKSALVYYPMGGREEQPTFPVETGWIGQCDCTQQQDGAMAGDECNLESKHCEQDGPCARHGSKPFPCISSLYPHNDSLRKILFIMSVFQLRTLRQSTRETWQRGHISNQQESGDQKS